MKPSDFFVEQEDPLWDLHGRDPWSRMLQVFDADLVEQLRRGPKEDLPDIEVAYSLAQLARDELEAYGTSGKEKLNDEQMTLVTRTLIAVLGRLNVAFDLPFRDFKGFRGYWSSNGMSGAGGWGMRRGYITELFVPVFSELELIEQQNAAGSYRGVDGELRNIIFASTGAKPRIVLRDAINNIIEITRHADLCLFYDRPLANSGLTWPELVAWWCARESLDELPLIDVARQLYGRLRRSLESEPEDILFKTYYELYGPRIETTPPALLPQVYLHYDPRTRWERGGKDSELARERMDFLLLLPGGTRIVLEVDGKQHYAEGDTASPQLYSEMVAADRQLRLKGYEMYRFGGHELTQSGADEMLRTFFGELLARHEVRA